MAEAAGRPPETGARRFFYGYVVVIASFFATMMAFGTMYSFGVFFKPVAEEFGWSRAVTSSAYALRNLMGGVLGIVGGRVNDRFGPRIVIVVSGVFLGLGYVLMSQVGAVWQLYLFYGVIVAVGASGSDVPLASTMVRWFVKRRATMIGVMLAGSSVGTMTIPLAAEWLIRNYAWRVSFAVIGIVALVVSVVAAQFLRRDPAQVGQEPYGAALVGEDGLSVETADVSMRQALRSSQFWMFFVALLCRGFTVQAIMLHIVPHITDLGISAVIAASVLTTIGAVSMLSRVINGGIADAVGARRALFLDYVIMVVALLWLLVAKDLWMLYLFGVLFGFAYAGLVSLGSPMAAELFGLRAHGAIFGLASFGGTIGATLGPFLAGLIFDINGDYSVAFAIAAAVGATGSVLTWLLKPQASEARR